MNMHPLEGHFAECFVNSSVTAEQLQHIAKCPKCLEELRQFEGTIASLRDTVRAGVDRRLNQLGGSATEVRRLEHAPGSLWKWVFAAAVIFSIGLLPLIFQSRQPQASSLDQDAAALMESINIQVSRELPAPMEPLMLVVPE